MVEGEEAFLACPPKHLKEPRGDFVPGCFMARDCIGMELDHANVVHSTSALFQ